MEIDTIRTFFMWCTLLNGGFLTLSSIIYLFAGDWVFQMHSKWFPISREAFNVAIYCFIGFFKIMFLLFNLVPYLALVIVA